MERVQTVVAGAGVVGLAIARELALSGREVLVLEAEPDFGTITSARNSEVIHAGIYYAPGSLKAKLCVEGRHRLYDYCAANGIRANRCGKLIVACNDDELESFGAIAARAHRNGVDDLRQIPAAEALAMEPELACVGALWSPSTGIVDSHTLMLTLLGEAEAHGGMLVLRTPIERVRADDGFVIETGGDEPMTLHAAEFVNSAGLGAPALAGRIEGLPADQVPQQWIAKGNYFGCAVRAPFQRLIYPAPVHGGLGIHLTIDLAGRARFGPDVQWIDEIDYSVDPARGDVFYDAIRTYWPGLPDGVLTPDYAGIRPKLGRDRHAADFRIDGAAAHGVAGYVGLYGIESPGLTSSLAIAAHVRALLG